MEHPPDPGQRDTSPPSDPSELQGLIESLAESGTVDTVAIGASDFNGIFSGKYLPLERFGRSLVHPTSIGDLFFVFDPAEGVTMEGPAVGWWPISERGLRELECIARPETFRVLPWRDRTAVCLCDFRFSGGGEPLEAAPQAVLHRVVERARRM